MDAFTRDGLTFEVVDEGPADGPVVVLLHGFPQSAAEWDAIVPRLTAQGYRCLAPNQRGYSPGARPRGRGAYRTRELTADVIALLDAAGADQAHVVGHDWGAAVAWALAIGYPDRMRTVSALSVPHPAAFVRALGTSRQFLESWYMYAFQLPWLPERAFAGPGGRARFERFLTGGGQTPERAARDAAAMLDGGALSTAINWYRAIPYTDPRRTSVRVRVPTMFVWSDGDRYISRTAADRCADWVAGPYRFEALRGVSHWIPEEAPERTSELLLEHFAAASG
jgi:pimeloyl-ACP methyl ester carboxylesterase